MPRARASTGSARGRSGLRARRPRRRRLPFNYGSGDDDPQDGAHGTFDQLYPLGHAYYGYIDPFALQNLRNTEVTPSVT